MYLFHVRMTPMELAAIRATLVVGSASLTALAQRAAQAGQTIIRNPNGLIWRPDTDAGKRLGAGADRTARSSGANPWGGRVEHQMAGRLDAEDVVTIRESLASGSAVPADLARQYRVSPAPSSRSRPTVPGNMSADQNWDQAGGRAPIPATGA